MSKDRKEFIKIGLKEIRGQVKAVFFNEGDFVIYYIPSLNLSAYGKTYSEAEDMMKNAVLRDFCHNLISKPKAFVFSELAKLGWTRDKIFRKDLSKTSFIDKEGILREFDLDKDTVINEKEFAITC
jgi:hypothetical protein